MVEKQKEIISLIDDLILNMKRRRAEVASSVQDILKLIEKIDEKTSRARKISADVGPYKSRYGAVDSENFRMSRIINATTATGMPLNGPLMFSYCFLQAL